ncbi:hypothetical protein AOLI_G00119380 [Acnodon oligacanthus]
MDLYKADHLFHLHRVTPGREEVLPSCRGNCVTTVTQRRTGVRFRGNSSGGWVKVTSSVNSFTHEPQGTTAIRLHFHWSPTSW